MNVLLLIKVIVSILDTSCFTFQLLKHDLCFDPNWLWCTWWVNDGYLLQFYLHMILTSSDTVWIMFKKGLVLYLPKSWIDTNRNSHASPSQSIRCGQSTLFTFELEWQWIFSYEWICKMEMIMPRIMSCSIFNSDPILFDYCPAYGYHCCR